MRKEPDPRDGKLACTLDDGTFIQKEKMKFKDFQNLSQAGISRKKREQTKRERLHMDGLIAAHLLKQRTKMDFKTYFQFKAPNKHLPAELKQVEELRQFMVLNGMDESLIAKQYFSTKNFN